MKSFLFIISLLFCFSLHAQKLTIDSFQENTKDLSARTSPRADNNGTPCALIKVQLAAADAEFEGNVVGDVKYSTSEYHVYMPSGSKRLKVKLTGYLPCDVEFGEYGVKALASQVTYVLTVSGVIANNAQTQEVRTKTGWIILDSEPSGAAVYINNEFVGNTPLDSYKQPYGTYNYRIEKPNYHDASGTVELNAAQVEKTIKLSPAFGAISVSSSVSGATVLLDGKNTGKVTPCTLNEIPSGKHTIIVQVSKYAPQQLTAVVEDGKTTSLTAKLDARFAHITINSLDGAQIYVDNAQKGTTNWSDDLMEGYYDAEVRLAHHKSVTKQIKVIAGVPQTISLNPTPIYGSLDITSTPRKADISIDGKHVGQTPYTVEQLLEGEHTVTLSLNGYATETKKVSISENNVASVNATLQNGRQITISTKEVGATVFVDGKEVGHSPYTGALSFGSHTTYAMLDGKKTSEQKVESSQGVGDLPSIVLSFGSNQTFTVKGVSFKMVYVEGGTFTMGATPEQENPRDVAKPAHQVTLTNDYYIGETEVTQALWKAVMGSNPSWFKGKNRPVEDVTWNDCKEFISKLNSLTGKNFRLPTEAEWEYAARGGINSRSYKYSGSNTLGDVAWHTDNSGSTTHDVGMKSPNELGLYDMSGNVGEWCADWYGGYSSSSLTNPIGPNSGSYRVFRGGCWGNFAGPCDSSFRNGYDPDFRKYNLGFRLALSE